jgi:protein-ribulosamine 3-kinase
VNSKLLTHISTSISEATQRPFKIRNSISVGGGSINEAYRLEGTDGALYFLKFNDAQHLAMFAAEEKGLAAIAATNTIRVPQPIAQGSASGQCYLVLEYLELNSRGNAKLLGEQLAALHRCIGVGFGFSQDNFIGTTPQPNGWPKNGKADWINFWREHRLGFQLRLASAKDCRTRCPRSSKTTPRNPRCCMAICGAATMHSFRMAPRPSSIPPLITATANAT